MTGINEADMNRINEFLERNKFDRSPDLLCPDDDEQADEVGDDDVPPSRAIPREKQ